ncbi:MAG: tetratricopeptide repeat protein [Coriobacteriia bacterium]|nr:tetratricopeptide repeat protein [Coriobacteriia bacterium]
MSEKVPDVMMYRKGLKLTGGYKAYIDRLYDDVKDYLEPQKFIHYTDHTIRHSLRIEDQITPIIQSLTEKLTPSEKAILLGAVLLHDVGMQSYIPDALYNAEENLSIKQLDDIRAAHNKLSYDYIEQAIKASDPDSLQSAIRKQNFENIINGIALISLYHRDKYYLNAIRYDLYLHDNVLNDIQNGNDKVRSRLLAALIRLGDALDMDWQRVNIDELKTKLRIPEHSRFLWYCHYYVNMIQVCNNRVEVEFRFPAEYDPESIYRKAIISYVLRGLQDQLDEVRPQLEEQQIHLNGVIELDPRENFVMHKMPPDIEVYIASGRYLNNPDKETDKPGAPKTVISSVDESDEESTSTHRIWNLPNRDRDFIGRQSYLKWMNEYFAGGPENHTLTIVGTGGFGKSSIAIEYAYRNAEAYDYVWFVNADSQTSIEESLRSFAYQTGLEWALAEKDMSLVLNYVQKWQWATNRYLFIFDNTEGAGDISGYLPEGLPGGHFIVTTRDGSIKYGVTRRLNEFSIKDSVSYLRNNSRVKGITVYEAKALAWQLGNLPLALKHALAYMDKAMIGCSQYLEELEKHGLEMLDKGATRDVNNNPPVSATWQASMEQIQSETAQWLFNLCAYCAPDDIPLSLFIKGSRQLPASAFLDNLQSLDELGIYDLVQDLDHYSLVSFTRDNTSEVYMSIHRLIQKVTREKHTKKEDASWIKTCLEIALDAIPRDLSTPDARVMLSRYLPHALAIADEANANKLLRSCETRELIARLFNWAGCALEEIGNYPESLSCHHKALAIREQILGEEHLDTATTYNNLAMVYHDMGNYVMAHEYYKKAMTVREQLLGEKHPDTAEIYNNIGLACRDLGDYKKALHYVEKALEIREDMLGKKHTKTAIIYNSIARIYRSLGDYTKALLFFKLALEIREQKLGDMHPDTAETYNNMALVNLDLGHYMKAMQYFEKALIVRKTILGEVHPDTATTYNNMAEVFRDQGDYGKALEYHEKALAVRRLLLGEEHPNTSNTYNNMAAVYRAQGNYTKAQEYNEKALAIRHQVLGDDHPNTATTYNEIASVYYAQGDYAKALEWYGKALVIREEILGDRHPDTATTYNNMAMVYYTQGDYAKALEWYGKALAIREEVLGDRHPSTAAIYNNIALVYRATSDYTKALEFYSKSLEIKKEVLGDRHPDTSTTYNNMAMIYREQGDYTKALELYEKVQAIREEVLGDRHPRTATTYNNMALVYEDQDDYTRALILFEKALAIREEVLGDLHPDTAITYVNIAGIYRAQGNYKMSLEYYDKALAIRKTALGEGHPYTATVYNKIAIVLSKQGDNSMALNYYGKALAVYEKVFGIGSPRTNKYSNDMKTSYEKSKPAVPFEQWWEKHRADFEPNGESQSSSE